MHATRDCALCEGRGTRPRERRRVADGSPDPLDLLGRFPGLCEACGGTGRSPEAPPAAARKPPGRAADL